MLQPQMKGWSSPEPPQELLLCDKVSVPPWSICHTMPLLWGAEEMLTHGNAGQEIPVGEQTVGPEQ